MESAAAALADFFAARCVFDWGRAGAVAPSSGHTIYR